MRATLVPRGALALATLALVVAGCGRSNSHRTAAAPSNIEWVGSTQTIVSSIVSGGPAFSIVGQRYRFWGRMYLQIGLRFTEPWRVGEGSFSSSWGGSPLVQEAVNVSDACQVHPFVVMDGLITRSGDTVLAQTDGGAVYLRQVALPASLHWNGVLVYGSAPSSPTGFLIHTSAGKIVRLTQESSGRTVGIGRCDGQEPQWVNAHFSPAVASKALAKIVECMRNHGFEVGAPAESGFERFWATKWQQYRTVQELCRREASSTIS